MQLDIKRFYEIVKEIKGLTDEKLLYFIELCEYLEKSCGGCKKKEARYRMIKLFEGFGAGLNNHDRELIKNGKEIELTNMDKIVGKL